MLQCRLGGCWVDDLFDFLRWLPSPSLAWSSPNKQQPRPMAKRPMVQSGMFGEMARGQGHRLPLARCCHAKDEGHRGMVWEHRKNKQLRHVLFFRCFFAHASYTASQGQEMNTCGRHQSMMILAKKHSSLLRSYAPCGFCACYACFAFSKVWRRPCDSPGWDKGGFTGRSKSKLLSWSRA